MYNGSSDSFYCTNLMKLTLEIPLRISMASLGYSIIKERFRNGSRTKKRRSDRLSERQIYTTKDALSSVNFTT